MQVAVQIGKKKLSTGVLEEGDQLIALAFHVVDEEVGGGVAELGHQVHQRHRVLIGHLNDHRPPMRGSSALGGLCGGGGGCCCCEESKDERTLMRCEVASVSSEWATNMPLLCATAAWNGSCASASRWYSPTTDRYSSHTDLQWTTKKETSQVTQIKLGSIGETR